MTILIRKTNQVRKILKILDEEGFIELMLILKNYLILHLYKTFLSRNGVILKKIHGSKMYLDLSRPGIFETLAIYGTREKLEAEILKKELKEGMSVLDIGANIGYYTLMEALVVKDKGKVYAFEPESKNFELLNKNVKENNYFNIVRTYPFAVSDKNSIAKLYLSEQSNLHTMIDPRILGRESFTSNFLNVKSVKIDDFLKNEPPIDFIRMDIEGYECMAIDGMVELLGKTIRHIKLLIEVHPHSYNDKELDFKKRLKILDNFGFYVKYLVSAGVAEPEMSRDFGYKPIKTVSEGRWTRGLYKNVRMKDLLDFLDNETKIVRAIFLERKL
jgi:FkbM family methyltransferase